LDSGHHAVIGIHRPRDGRDFSPWEVARLNRLLPHLRRALEMRQRLRKVEHPGDSAFLALDRLRLGVIMMDAMGRLLQVNAAAEAILRSGDGLSRTPSGLRAGRKEDDKRLQDLVAALRHDSGNLRSAGGHLRIQRPSGRQAYAVMLTPAGPTLLGGGKGSPAILVFVSDPAESVRLDPSVLAEMFGFPPTEARLVLALLSGMTPPEFARKSGITYNTVRTLLGRAMARTDTCSQLELVLLIANSLGGTISERNHCEQRAPRDPAVSSTIDFAASYALRR
jgi:DNA-binding CsgD family transcriptional regulator